MQIQAVKFKGFLILYMYGSCTIYVQKDMYMYTSTTSLQYFPEQTFPLVSKYKMTHPWSEESVECGL